MQPGDEMGIPLHQYLLLYSRDGCHFGFEKSEKSSFSFIVELIAFVGSYIFYFVESVKVDFEDLITTDGLNLVD